MSSEKVRVSYDLRPELPRVRPCLPKVIHYGVLGGILGIAGFAGLFGINKLQQSKIEGQIASYDARSSVLVADANSFRQSAAKLRKAADLGWEIRLWDKVSPSTSDFVLELISDEVVPTDVTLTSLKVSRDPGNRKVTVTVQTKSNNAGGNSYLANMLDRIRAMGYGQPEYGIDPISGGQRIEVKCQVPLDGVEIKEVI